MSCLKRRERNCCIRCCNVVKKGPIHSWSWRLASFSVLFQCYFSLSSVFSFTLQARSVFITHRWPVLLTILKVSSVLWLLAIDSQSSLSASLSFQLLHSQMGAESRTRQHNRNFSIYGLSKQVFELLPARFMASLKWVIYLLIKLTLTISACKIQRCVKVFSKIKLPYHLSKSWFLFSHICRSMFRTEHLRLVFCWVITCTISRDLVVIRQYTLCKTTLWLRCFTYYSMDWEFSITILFTLGTYGDYPEWIVGCYLRKINHYLGSWSDGVYMI